VWGGGTFKNGIYKQDINKPDYKILYKIKGFEPILTISKKRNCLIKNILKYKPKIV
jgi:hypothetical protein